jgi:hypothetical protein
VGDTGDLDDTVRRIEAFLRAERHPELDAHLRRLLETLDARGTSEEMESVCRWLVWRGLMFHSDLQWRSAQFEPLCRTVVDAMHWIDDLAGAEVGAEAVGMGLMAPDHRERWEREARARSLSFLVHALELFQALEVALLREREEGP